MADSEKLTVILPSEMVCLLKAWIVTGQYASESEAVLEGLKYLATQKSNENRAIKQWFREGVYPTDLEDKR
ncbi:hypothetical protein JMM46_004602 [Salmonella enterica]|nr:hypothetical protein [Salmonella enterica]EIK1510032.1 hypothetical protein [Salmonella enterica]